MKITSKKSFLLILLVLIVLLACAKRKTVMVNYNPEEDFNRALSAFESKQYNKAIEMFQNVLFNYPGTSYAGDAQFYIANAYFMKKNYRDAIYEFEFFIKSFLGSQYLEEAYYKLALCYYYLAPTVIRDQSFLYKTVEILDELQEKFPATKYTDEINRLKREVAERWAQKEFIVGELYYKAGELTSAQVYFQYLLDNFPSTKWAERSTLLLAQIYEKKDSLDKAINLYQMLSNATETDTAIKKIAQMRLKQLGVSP
ncbi:MAG: outer membrane protein assembly factor BamD [candidate division WOR-3 bacterium]|nr:outer membrane protein assembly factor BamD [candidate division WOR-3 bacterium]